MHKEAIGAHDIEGRGCKVRLFDRDTKEARMGTTKNLFVEATAEATASK